MPTLSDVATILVDMLEKIIWEVAKIISENAEIIARALISVPISYIVFPRLIRTLKGLDRWLRGV